MHSAGFHSFIHSHLLSAWTYDISALETNDFSPVLLLHRKIVGHHDLLA